MCDTSSSCVTHLCKVILKPIQQWQTQTSMHFYKNPYQDFGGTWFLLKTIKSPDFGGDIKKTTETLQPKPSMIYKMFEQLTHNILSLVF
jgi:hypothetical protein